MLKKLILLLISLIAFPVAISSGSYSFNHASMVVADEDDPEEPEPEPDLGPSPYTYYEEPGHELGLINRYYEPCDLIPTVRKKFCAPSGYTFTLYYTDEQIDLLIQEMDR